MAENTEYVSCEQIIHDIKTPLSIMYNNIREIELMSLKSPEISLALESLKRNWLRILKLVTDASDYQKLSMGLMMPKLSNHDMVAIVRNITESTRALTARKDIRLVFETTVTEKKMAVDKDIIDRILLNLLSNAIKFTNPSGEVRVIVSEKEDMLVLTVRDNGIGIEAEHAGRIFEPHFFVQGLENKSGTGMGLFIVKQLVSLLEGEIYLEPVTTGTSIVVRLPCFVSEVSEQELKYYDDFYSDNMVQIELSDAHYSGK